MIKKEIKTGIYKIKNKTDNKIYIGQAKDIEKRWKTHKRTKYPEDLFSYEILMECDLEQLNFWEIAWITSENACDPDVGYNKALGGTSLKNIIKSDELKAKLSAALKGKGKGRKKSPETIVRMTAAQRGRGKRGKHTDEHKAKISLACKGKNKGIKNFLGRTHTDEAKAKISAANMGHSVSDKTRAAVSASNKIRIVSDETKAKLSAVNKGKVISEETKQKLSAANKGKVMSEEQKDKLRKPCVINGIKYLCADVAADALGINVKTLRGYLTGFRKWPKKKNMSGYYIDEKLDDQGTFDS
jgi:group I intron endonuclease